MNKRIISCISLLLLGSCAVPQLQEEPYSRAGAGSSLVGVSSGWALYDAKVSVKGRSGSLEREVGDDTTTLTPQYGGALKYSYFVTDNLSLGGIVELRSFEPDPVMPLSAELVADSFETFHLLGSSRWFFDPMGASRRWRPFIGLDVSYVPDVDLGQVEVNYPGGIPSERVRAKGSAYWSIAPVAGMSYQLVDGMTLDFGAFYEMPLTASEAEVQFQNLGGAEADVRVEPEGLIGFMGVSWQL